jgi:hypothetical protein
MYLTVGTGKYNTAVLKHHCMESVPQEWWNAFGSTPNKLIERINTNHDKIFEKKDHCPSIYLKLLSNTAWSRCRKNGGMPLAFTLSIHPTLNPSLTLCI